MASKAAHYGIKTDQVTGWIDYPLPINVSLRTEMHLSRKQVRSLIVHLKAWLKTGQFEAE